jgi:hypothetical protein
MMADEIEAAFDHADERSTFVRCMSPHLADFAEKVFGCSG